MGIEHVLYFGGFATRRELLELLRTTLREARQKHQWTTWSACKKANRDLSYVAMHQVTAVLAELEVELSFKVVRTDDDLIVLFEGSEQ